MKIEATYPVPVPVAVQNNRCGSTV